MAEITRAVSWEAPEHRHIEKSSDWFWAVSIIAIAAAVAAVLFNNALFGIVILLAASVMILFAHREPSVLEYEVSMRGIRVGDSFCPYTDIESFYIDCENPLGPQLIAKPNGLFSQFIIIPIPEDHIDDIDDIVAARVPEEFLEEPLSHRLLEFFGL